MNFAKHNAREVEAVRIITKFLKKKLLYKRIKEELRLPGFKYCSGVVRTLGLALVYTMVANDENSHFVLKLTERETDPKKPVKIVDRGYIKYDVMADALRKTTAKEEGC